MSFEPVEPLWVGLFGLGVYRSRLSIDAVPIQPSCGNRFEFSMAFVPGKLGVTATNEGSSTTHLTLRPTPPRRHQIVSPGMGTMARQALGVRGSEICVGIFGQQRGPMGS